MEYASKGVANTALGLSIGSGVLSLLGGGWGNLLGMNGCCGNCCGESAPVNRYELSLVQSNAAKDAEIGLLKADKYTDQKIVEAYKDLQSQITAIKDNQTAVNMQQAVYNGTNTATISCMQQQIAALQALTKLVVPNSSVCPGWGNVTITPAAAATTPAA